MNSHDDAGVRKCHEYLGPGISVAHFNEARLNALKEEQKRETQELPQVDPSLRRLIIGSIAGTIALAVIIAAAFWLPQDVTGTIQEWINMYLP